MEKIYLSLLNSSLINGFRKGLLVENDPYEVWKDAMKNENIMIIGIPHQEDENLFSPVRTWVPKK